MLTDGIVKAFQMLAALDEEILGVAFMTFQVSGTATVLSVVLGIPLGLWLALCDFPGKRFMRSLVNFGMGLPPVVVGLLVSICLWRYGPLGDLGLMYTPAAMIIAQTIIAAPIVAGLSFAAVLGLNPQLEPQLISLGATRWQAIRLLVREAKLGLMAAVIAGFGRVISEVGASMMVGGNIKGQTRVLTTATVMEVGKGNYDTAIAISLILLLGAFGVVLALTWLQHKGKSEQA
ncbi:MAG: ABC transporter permease [Peptococcaceae bacterium]|nr:ABC transporter permease [Peptococcaceae bacterium]